MVIQRRLTAFSHNSERAGTSADATRYDDSQHLNSHQVWSIVSPLLQWLAWTATGHETVPLEERGDIFAPVDSSIASQCLPMHAAFVSHSNRSTSMALEKSDVLFEFTMNLSRPSRCHVLCRCPACRLAVSYGSRAISRL